MIKNIFIYFVSILILNSCFGLSEESEKFIYKKGKSSVKLKILNGSDYLIYDTPTRVDFEWKNIDLKTSSIYGLGVKILGSKNEVTKTEIAIPSNYLTKDSLDLKLNFKINGEDITTKFIIPLKTR